MDLINREEVHDLIAKRLSDYLTDESRNELEELDIKVEEDIPTVQAVPIEVLQEIRQEINDEFLRCDTNAWSDVAKGLLSARYIIDKKIKELSE